MPVKAPERRTAPREKGTRPGSEEGFLTRVAWLYYVGGLTQSEIAKQLGETRLRINRALSQARQSGIVRIEIASPHAATLRLQNDLTARFGLRDALVGVSDQAGADPHDVVGATLAIFLKDYLRTQSCEAIGVSWGSTLDRAVGWLEPADRPDIELVSLLGGLSKGASINTFGIAANFANVLNAQHSLFAAPIYADTAETAQAMLQSALFRDQVARASRVDIALLSAGDVSDRSHLVRDGLPKDVTVGDLKEAGAVGDILGRFLDDQGKPIDHPINERVISLPYEEIKSMRHAVLAAAGAHKVPVIRAAIEDGLIHTLITDDLTAELLLDGRPSKANSD